MQEINFQDPRVLRRCRQALGFTAACFDVEEPKQASTAWLNKHFGRTQNSLSKWLRANLLITRDYHYNSQTGTCRKYCRDTSGMRYVRACVEGKFRGTRRQWEQLKSASTTSRDFHNEAADWGRQAFADELSSLNFNYQDKSHRLWHPLQMVRKPIKIPLQIDAGLRHHYDIQSAALTLLHQYSQQLPEHLSYHGDWIRGPMDLWLFGIQGYLKDRRYWRQKWSKDLGVPEKTIKSIITALTAGARIANTPQSSIAAMLDHNSAKIKALQAHPEIQELRNDLRTMWDYIRRYQPWRTITTKNGHTRRLPLSSQAKWGIYFTLERRVLNSVRKYLDSNGIKYFLEHDGWATDRPIDQQQLQQAVLRDTGYLIQLEYHNYS